MKQRLMFSSLSVYLSLSLVLHSAHTCTTVFANHQGPIPVVARSMDLYVSDSPRLLVSPKGVMRQGEAGKQSVQWHAQYGTVVVTAFESSAVSDGMNEHGLAAHLLYLTSTEYQKDDPKLLKLSNTLWVQYILDNYKTVSEALAGLKSIQVVSTKVFNREWPVHLAMEDASGDSAIVEFEKGEMHVYHGSQYNVMTNEPAFPIQLDNLKHYKLFGGQLPLPGDTDPLSRFVRASTYLRTLPVSDKPLNAIAGVLSVIRSALVPFGAEDTSGHNTIDAWSTRWVSVADLKNKTYYFNSMTMPNIIWLDLKELNFSEGKPVLEVDPNNLHWTGNVAKHLKAI